MYRSPGVLLIALLLWSGWSARTVQEATPAPTASPDSQLIGFTRERARWQWELESRIPSLISTERMRLYHRALTAEPHHAGTEANERTAEYLAERLREFGFDSVAFYRYEVLLPRPVERRVELVAPERYRLRLSEPPLPPDPDTRKSGVLPPFNAYSADGSVEAEVVYVNYGIPEDYRVLDSLGISVEGKIVLARYGRSWRGIKPKVAAEHGAIAVLLYSDPADDGYVRGDVMPDGKWRPEWGVQRGSVMDMPIYPGDPQTPGYPSKPGAQRLPLSEVPTLQKIPVLPISYGDALPILRNLKGPVAPESWRGGLPVTYHIGPGPARVRMTVRQDWSVRPIVNVIGYLWGSEARDKIIMAGGHRDAWTFGGRDPISGAVSLLESARALAQLARDGHRPRRTIAIASWDAEEYGLIGSTEYAEEFAEQLRQQLILYLNRESYTAGDFEAGGSHALEPFINEVTRAVPAPEGLGTIWNFWKARTADRRIVRTDAGERIRITALGSGSDYTAFLDHLGIPSVNLGFDSGNGIYHSRYDTHWFFITYGDPGFRYGERLADLVARFLLRLANADILPFDYAITAETIQHYLDELEDLQTRHLKTPVDLSSVRRAARVLEATAVAFRAERDRILQLPAARLAAHRGTLAIINEHLQRAEQGFLHPEGLPGRPWFRHTLYAPGLYTGYGVKTLPGIREAIEQGNAAEAQAMAEATAAALERVRQHLVAAIAAASTIR